MSKVLETKLDDLRPEYDFSRLHEVHPPGYYSARYHTEPPQVSDRDTRTIDRILLLLLLSVVAVWAVLMARAFRRSLHGLDDVGDLGDERPSSAGQLP